jgi:hypothetical protein
LPGSLPRLSVFYLIATQGRSGRKLRAFFLLTPFRSGFKLHLVIISDILSLPFARGKMRGGLFLEFPNK